MTASKPILIGLTACALAFAGTASAQEVDVDVESEPETTPDPDVEIEVDEPDVDVEVETPAPEQPPPVAPAPAPEVEMEMEQPPPTTYEPLPPEPVVERRAGEPNLVTPFGTAVSVGGGVRGFAEEEARDVASTGGAWDARLLLGSRSFVGFEAAYVGSAGGIDALGLDPDATLVQNGVEGAVRLNILTGMWQPYLLAGAGWSRYTITGEDFNTSDIAGSDDVAQFPLGAGVAFRYDGFVADLRGVYRPTAEADLIPATGGNMPTWNANATAGVEF